MILKRCNNGHYYDGEKYAECPECSGAGANFGMGPAQAFDGDYADEDSVTVALPRSRGQGMQGSTASTVPLPRGKRKQADDWDDDVTVALPRNHGQGMQADDVTSALVRKPVKNTSGKQGFKPVVGWFVCIRGQDFGRSFALKLGKNYIGRAADMDVCLQGDESVAMKNHAVICYVPKQRRFAVEMGTSGRQFYLNRNVVVRPVWIKQHDILTIGNVSLMFFPCCGEHFSWEELIRKRRERNQGM